MCHNVAYVIPYDPDLSSTRSPQLRPGTQPAFRMHVEGQNNHRDRPYINTPPTSYVIAQHPLH